MAMEVVYKAFLHREGDSSYGVTFPDFPGCVSAGETLEEALENGREALQFMIDSLYEEGTEIPRPGVLDPAWLKERCDDIELVAAIPANVSSKRVRINVSMSDYVLERLDEYAAKVGLSRSTVLTEAVGRYINEERSVYSKSGDS